MGSSQGETESYPWGPASGGTDEATGLPTVGTSFGDFELIRVVGRGAHGQVYLARQISLDRIVALKVASDSGDEARTMATLEHESIVKVYSESFDPSGRWRLLCMQFVDGPTLAPIIDEVRQKGPDSLRGEGILDVIDGRNTYPSRLDPVALRYREVVARSDFYDTVCLLGAQLADALGYAHRRNVLHRDVKPANVLVNQYGQVLLADFSVSSHATRLKSHRDGLLGGTIPYMSPEHLDAFWKNDQTSAVIQEPADIFSLGVVLFELVTGELPFPVLNHGATNEDLKAMSEARRRGAPPLCSRRPDPPPSLEYVIGKCLAPEPKNRFATPEEVSRNLTGCRELRRVERELPRGHFLTRWITHRPILSLILFATLPHLLGSFVNIAYNRARIVELLSPEQLDSFWNLVIAYNSVAYPVCLGWALYLISLLLRGWARVRELDSPALEVLRRRTLRFPGWIVAISAAGWFPGAIVFPLYLHIWAGGIAPSIFGHFAVSFVLSGLIALIYSYFGVLLVAIRALYPRLWLDVSSLVATASSELHRIPFWSRSFRWFTLAIPLTGAMLFLGVTTDLTLDFRMLIIALIFLGLAGFSVANHATRLILGTVAAFTGKQS